jgi:hypothetical protein
MPAKPHHSLSKTADSFPGSRVKSALRGRDGAKVDPRCYWCGKSIDPVVYARALHETVSYAVCGENCPEWKPGAIFIGFAGPKK